MRSGTEPRASHRAVVLTSGAIVLVLLAQLTVMFACMLKPLGVPCNQRLAWPFLDYPMYSRAFQPGDEIERHVVFGLLADGSEVEIQAQDVGLTFWFFRYHVVKPIVRGEPARLRPYVERYATRHGVKLVGMRLEDRPSVLHRDGLRPGEPRTVKKILFDERAR